MRVLIHACDSCGREFERPRRLRYVRTFCSIICSGAFHSGNANGFWKPSRTPHADGYALEKAADHRRSHNGAVLAHILVAERALGKALPKEAVVHHVNGEPSDNALHNLVICQDQGYHMLLHMRQNRLRAFGSLSVKQCFDCGRVMPLDRFYRWTYSPDGRANHCATCSKKRATDYYYRRKKQRASACPTSTR